VKTVGNKVTRHSLAYLFMQKWSWGSPLKHKFTLGKPPLGAAAVLISA